MKIRTRTTLVKAATTAAVVALTVAAWPATIASAAVADPALGSATADSGVIESNSRSARSTCVFFMEGDYAHISSSAPRTASAYGWWRNVRGCAGLKARVTTQLQRQNANGTWTNIGSVGRATVYSGGGSANRTVTRHTCVGSTTRTYRHWVDVDVIGAADAPNKHYSPARSLQCG